MIHLICPNPAVDRTLLFEIIETAIPNRPLTVKEFPGGKSFNVAYSLSYDTVRSDITIHTMLGGLYGEQVFHLADEKGYHLEVTAVEKNTRLCNILVDTTSKEIIPIYENGFKLDCELLNKFTDTLVSSIKDDDILVFSGSLMKGMPDGYIATIEKKLTHLKIHFKLCVDTSGAALLSTYKEAHPFLIKINDEEIKDIFPTKKLENLTDYINLLKHDVDHTIKHFIVTLGKKGIVARMNNQIYTGSAKPVEAKNPVACGDFFLGRLIHGFASNRSEVDTLTSALLFSTCNVINWFPEVTDEQLDTILPTITVNKLD